LAVETDSEPGMLSNKYLSKSVSYSDIKLLFSCYNRVLLIVLFYMYCMCSADNVIVNCLCRNLDLLYWRVC